jgi:hypothetical protein
MIKLPRIPDNIQKKEFRKHMSTKGTKFNIEGIQWAGKPAVFEIGEGYILKGGSMYSMNIGYTGDTKMDLYTFDMMGKKTTATIKFADVVIISSALPLPADMEVKEVMAA